MRAVLSYGLVTFGRLTVFAIDGNVGKVARGVGSTRRPRKELAQLQEKPVHRPLKRVAYRPREVAEMVGMSESGVRNLIRRGRLRAVQLDGRWLIPATAIEDKLGIQLDASTAADAAPDAAQTPA
jgi:excisionase family DNA binding protein